MNIPELYETIPLTVIIAPFRTNFVVEQDHSLAQAISHAGGLMIFRTMGVHVSKRGSRAIAVGKRRKYPQRGSGLTLYYITLNVRPPGGCSKSCYKSHKDGCQ
jgi:hypothetical protein